MADEQKKYYLENIPMTDEQKKYYDERLAEIPKDVLQKAVAHLKNLIPPIERAQIKEEVRKHGSQEWIHQVGELGLHFGWGMAIRNQLREAGLSDSMLPLGNWDDYYVACIEIACGARDLP